MCFLWLSTGTTKRTKNKNFEYTHQILGGSKIESPNSENHNYIQIITSFAYYLHMINFMFCYIMYRDQIW